MTAAAILDRPQRIYRTDNSYTTVSTLLSINNMSKLISLLLLALLPLLVVAQTTTVKGVVTSVSGDPLLGAIVSAQHGKIRTATKEDGTFSITAPLGSRLEVRYIGMKTARVVATSTLLRIALEDENFLGEAVVTGYQKIKSRVFTGAASSVKLDEIKMEGVADVSRLLEGRIAGLSIQNISGSFGSAPRINIRGGASILGDVQPLWVIDGAVYEDLVSLTLDQLASGDAVTLISSAVAGLNPSDIADIQVLKDASATSIYGARALNGVIVVTTRSGKRDTPNQVTYSLELSQRLVPRYSDYDLLNSQETMSIYREMEHKGYFSLLSSLYGRRSGVYHQLYRAQNTLDPLTGNYLLPNTDAAALEFLRSREYANTDWFKHLFINRPIHNHTLTFTGGGKNSGLYASLGYYEDLGWTLADGVRRITANLKSTFYLGDKCSATFMAQGNMRSQNAPGTVPQRKNTAIGAFERDFDINPFAYALGTSRTLRPYNERGDREYYRNNWAPFNILNEYDNNYMKTEVVDFKIQSDLSYRLSSTVELKSLLALRRATTSTSHYIKEASNVVQAFRANETPYVAAQNIYLLRDPSNPDNQPQIALTHGGIYNHHQTTMESYIGRLAADYEESFGHHHLRAFAFGEVRQTRRALTPFEGYGIQYDRGNQVFTNPLIFDKLTREGREYFALTHRTDRGVTFSGSATYGYDGRYVFNTVLNYEGSNAAGKGAGSRWLPTWNVGAKWNIDRERFLRNHSVVSRLALRVSYGLTAKINEHAANANAVFRNELIPRLQIENRENALRILHLENRDLTWEKMYELNFGVEAGFYDNRISTTLDLYRRNSFDLIDLVRTSGVGGQYYKYANFGDMVTNGVELAVHTKNVVTSRFKWTTSFTLSAMHQEITRMLNTPNAFDMVSGTGRGNVKGFPRGSLFSFNFQGLNAEGLPTFDFGNYPSDKRPHSSIAGADFSDTRYVKSYLIYHGSIEPKFMGGLSNTFTFGNWECSFFLTMQAGNKIRLNPTFDPAFADLNVFSKEYFDRWLAPGDELLTDVPTLPSSELLELYGRENIERAYNTYNYSQVRVADGSFVRLKNVSLAYDLPQRFTRSIGLSKANVKLNVTNPCLLYADRRLRGQDPEFYKSGGVSLPTPKQYTLTLHLVF